MNVDTRGGGAFAHPLPNEVCCLGSCNMLTVVSQKRAHGRVTLPWAQTGGWADIRAIIVVYY